MLRAAVVIAPLKRIGKDELLSLLTVNPGDVTPVDGHRYHWVREVLWASSDDLTALHVRCSCGRWIGGSL